MTANTEATAKTEAPAGGGSGERQESAHSGQEAQQKSSTKRELLEPGGNDAARFSTTVGGAVAYVRAGWALVDIPRGAKGPNCPAWNLSQSCVRREDEAELLRGNVGLAHAYSRTCALDLDDLDRAREWLAQCTPAVDVDALLADDHAVQISSGRENRAKLLFRLPDGVDPLPTKDMGRGGGFELRCGTQGGLTVQDVLPPSIHPDTGRPYEWKLGPHAAWANPPVLPDALLRLWRALLGNERNASKEAPARLKAGEAAPPPASDEIDERRARLSGLDPDITYNDWVRVGMALHHESAGDTWGLDLWDEWSATGVKYKGTADLEKHWRSFGKSTTRPVTWNTVMAMTATATTLDFEDLTGEADGAGARAAPTLGDSRTADSAEPEPLVAPPAPGEPWPLDALGEILADAARTICNAVQCPEGLAGPSVLTAATLAVQGHFDMLHPLGHAAPCSLVLITLGESGERKSTADKLANQRFHDAAAEAEERYRTEYRDYLAEMEAREAVKSRIKSAKQGDARTPEEMAKQLSAMGPPPFAPIPPRRIVTDPNFEGLVRWLATANGSVAWMSNEAGASVGGTAFADENKLKFGAGLSLLWDGQAIERVRSGEGHHSLPGRRVTCHLMLQNEIARPFLADPILRWQGWLSRALICEPESRIGSRPWKEPGDIKAALAAYYGRIERFIRTPHPLEDKDGPPNVLRPRPLPWDDEARRLWIAFHDEVEATLAPGAAMAEHRGFGAKVAENAARIATVLAAFAGAKTVGASHLSQGIVIAGYYIDETIRQREAASVDESLALAEAVRIWLMREKPGATVSLREIQRLGPNKTRQKEVAKRCVAILREAGWLDGPTNGPWKVRGRG
jgi:hypothetical protein